MRCKFTDADGRTRAGLDGETQWGPGITHSITWSGRLCQEGVLHAYADPLLAVVADPIHGHYLRKPGALLWRIEGTGSYATNGLIEGWDTITTIETIPIPEMTTHQRVEIGIRRSLDVCKEPSYIQWAENWLSGKDRTAQTALAVVPGWAAAWAAPWAAPAAGWAAWAAARPAETAWAVARVAERAESPRVARASAWAAWAVEETVSTRPPGERLLEIIRQVMEVDR